MKGKKYKKWKRKKNVKEKTTGRRMWLNWCSEYTLPVFRDQFFFFRSETSWLFNDSLFGKCGKINYQTFRDLTIGIRQSLDKVGVAFLVLSTFSCHPVHAWLYWQNTNCGCHLGTALGRIWCGRAGHCARPDMVWSGWPKIRRHGLVSLTMTSLMAGEGDTECVTCVSQVWW